jgi:hypothetical protein
MTSDTGYEEILASLERQYPGQINLSVRDFARAAGIAEGTVYNGICRKSKKRLPVRVTRVRNKPFFRVHDVARFLAELENG